LSRPIYPEAWADQLQADFDAYMERLYEAVDDDIQDMDDEILDVTGNYFCGCGDCERRAAWTFLMVRFVEAYRDGIITLEEEEVVPDVDLQGL